MIQYRSVYGDPATFFEMKKVSGKPVSIGSAAYNAIRAEIEDIIGDSISRIKGADWVFYGSGGYTYGLDAAGRIYIVGGAGSHNRGDFRLQKASQAKVDPQIVQDDLNIVVKHQASSKVTSEGMSSTAKFALLTAGLVAIGVVAVTVIRKKS